MKRIVFSATLLAITVLSIMPVYADNDEILIQELTQQAQQLTQKAQKLKEENAQKTKKVSPQELVKQIKALPDDNKKFVVQFIHDAHGALQALEEKNDLMNLGQKIWLTAIELEQQQVRFTQAKIQLYEAEQSLEKQQKKVRVKIDPKSNLYNQVATITDQLKNAAGTIIQGHASIKQMRDVDTLKKEISMRKSLLDTLKDVATNAEKNANPTEFYQELIAKLKT